MNYPHPSIAREGWPFVGGSLLLALLASAAGFWPSLAFWLAFVFCLQFFRDPARVVAGGPRSVLSPADGRIAVVEEADDPYLNRRALKVSVFMNVFNVHSNRSPIEGIVRQKWYSPGAFLNASLNKASAENERCALHLRTPDDRDVTCVQVAGLIARRILNYVEAGTSLAAGQRYGFIRFGSRVDVYLPLDVRVKVVIGERVLASSSVLAELG
ncbi:MAG: phosphatidylserine decarboxylase [Candidatus Accumulibacter sp.]|jgi:phosphatidylserine decarboxylase|nr:phosphatidylserine decarboxylase [Accumulibacter sp.]